MPLRRLRRRERAAAYALLGTVGEVVFTAVEASLHRSTRSARLEGHTYLWMPPIYGLCAVLYEPVHDRLRTEPLPQRAAVYAAAIIGVEYLTGRLIQRVAGVIPWDYTGRSRLQVHGATRLDYFPLWAAAGIALEPVDDALRSVRLGRAG
ncbi:MAG: putative ABC transporter permease [Candidatus Dormibacteraeota bacterium]|nr:putative ABC transporter permease [Candidatus Dormibacteraeota bacterium]